MAMLILLSACGAAGIPGVSSKSGKSDIDKNKIQQIGMSYSLPLFQPFDITEREQISTVVDYIV